jgi:hypothetical protein
LTFTVTLTGGSCAAVDVIGTARTGAAGNVVGTAGTGAAGDDVAGPGTGWTVGVVGAGEGRNHGLSVPSVGTGVVAGGGVVGVSVGAVGLAVAVGAGDAAGGGVEATRGVSGDVVAVAVFFVALPAAFLVALALLVVAGGACIGCTSHPAGWPGSAATSCVRSCCW